MVPLALWAVYLVHSEEAAIVLKMLQKRSKFNYPEELDSEIHCLSEMGSRSLLVRP